MKDPADISAIPAAPPSSEDFGPDYQCELNTSSSTHSDRQLPSHMRRRDGHSPKSCLKKTSQREPRRVPPKRSVSADQLSLRVRLPGHTKPITRQRSITFDESVRVRRVPSAAELNEDKRDELWFQSEEYDTIKRKTYSLIRAIQQGQTGGVNYCTRGLEKYFHAEKVQQRRAAAWDSVFYTQEGQRRAGSFDDLQVASAYKNISSQSEEEAANRGRDDEVSIERYLKRTREVVRTRSMPTAQLARSG